MRERQKILSVIKPVAGALVLASIVSILAVAFAQMPESGNSFVKLLLAGLYLLVPYALTLLLAKKVKSLPVYLLLSIASIIPVILLPIWALYKVVLVIIAGILVALRASARMKDEEDFTQTPHAVFLAFFFVAYLVGGGFKSPLMMTINYYMAFAYVLLFIVYSNFKKLNDYLVINQNVENIPYDQISRTNYGTLFIYLALTVILMVALQLLGVDKLMAQFGQAMKDLLARLINTSSEVVPGTSASLETDPSGGMQEMPDGIAIIKETPKWLTVFYSVLSWIARILVIVILAGGAVFFAMKMMKQFYRSDKNSTDKDEFIKAQNDEKTSLLKTLSPMERVREAFDRSPNATVRKAYKKAVLKHGKEAPKASMTPREAEEFVGWPEGKERALLHGLYEKARYSKDGCTKEDVKTLRS